MGFLPLRKSMKMLFNGILRLIILVLLFALSLLAYKVLLEILFFVMDSNAILGGILAISFFVLFALAAGLAKTREYFPRLKKRKKEKGDRSIWDRII